MFHSGHLKPPPPIKKWLIDNIGGSREGVTGIATSPAFENGKEEFKKERKEKRKGKREEDGSKKCETDRKQPGGGGERAWLIQNLDE